MSKIYFITDPSYNWLINAFPCQITYGGKSYPSAENLFQSLKFLKLSPNIAEKVRISGDPLEEARKPENEDLARPDWYDVNFKMMILTLSVKFTRNRGLRKQLLATQSAELINNVTDLFWGVGEKHGGKNQFGLALMEVRKNLNLAEPPTLPEYTDPPGLTDDSKILFYDKNDNYYCFTNFSQDCVLLPGTGISIWSTSEQLFQAFKFPGHQALVDQIFLVKTASQAFAIANSKENENFIRKGWHEMKIAVMRYIVWLKFSQDEKLRNILTGTHPKYLIEASDKDAFWGWGANQLGQNQLGKALMRVRNIIRHGLPPPPRPDWVPEPTQAKQ